MEEVRGAKGEGQGEEWRRQGGGKEGCRERRGRNQGEGGEEARGKGGMSVGLEG
jgi:hypothetical protein